MYKRWFIYIYFFCLLASCSDIPNHNIDSLSIGNDNQINDFIPAYLAAIPQIKLSYKFYDNYIVENYVVRGTVDKANLLQGYWHIHDVKRNFTYQGRYINDLREEWWEVLFGDTLVCAGHYELNMKQGYWRYLAIGINKTSKYVNYKNDTLNGLAREFTADSILISDGEYLKGLKNGYWKFYYPNGILKEQGDYLDNMKSGWWQSFDVDGKLQQEASFSRGEISGYVIKYSNGIKSEEGQQFNEKKWGVWKYYDKNGNPIKIEELND